MEKKPKLLRTYVTKLISCVYPVFEKRKKPEAEVYPT